MTCLRSPASRARPREFCSQSGRARVCGFSEPLSAQDSKSPCFEPRPRQISLGKLRSGSPFPYGGGRWRCFPVKRFNETNEAGASGRARLRDVRCGRVRASTNSTRMARAPGCAPRARRRSPRRASARPAAGHCSPKRCPLRCDAMLSSEPFPRARVAFRDRDPSARLEDRAGLSRPRLIISLLTRRPTLPSSMTDPQSRGGLPRAV